MRAKLRMIWILLGPEELVALAAFITCVLVWCASVAVALR